MLIITDVLSNIKRLQEIVTALDVDGVGEVISYVPLKAAPGDGDRQVADRGLSAAAAGGLAPIRIVADERDQLHHPAGERTDTEHMKKLI